MTKKFTSDLTNSLLEISKQLDKNIEYNKKAINELNKEDRCISISLCDDELEFKENKPSYVEMKVLIYDPFSRKFIFQFNSKDNSYILPSRLTRSLFCNKIMILRSLSRFIHDLFYPYQITSDFKITMLPFQENFSLSNYDTMNNSSICMIASTILDDRDLIENISTQYFSAVNNLHFINIDNSFQFYNFSNLDLSIIESFKKNLKEG